MRAALNGSGSKKMNNGSSQKKSKQSKLDLKELQSLIKVLKDNEITEFEWSQGEEHIRLHCKDSHAVNSLAPQQAPSVSHQQSSLSQEGQIKAEAPKSDSRREIQSPFVGTFYRAPAPGADPYVKVGQKIRKGDVLCIVEAMKLMNEIEAEEDGVIAEVHADNGQPVEFGQPLFSFK
jgi:acetyl-CoA carboxylase biotin carboxyl carrier protein